MSAGLDQALIFLSYSTILMLIVITVFFVKLLIDLSNFANTLNQISSVFQHEIEPTLKELKKVIENINTMALQADKQIDNVRKVVEVISSTSGVALGKVKGFYSGILKGVFTGVKFVSKFKK